MVFAGLTEFLILAALGKILRYFNSALRCFKASIGDFLPILKSELRVLYDFVTI